MNLRLNIENLILIAVLCVITASCAGKGMSIDEKLASAEDEIIRSGITDVWRAKREDKIMSVVSFLEKPGLRQEAAFGLANTGGETTDAIVLNRMQGAGKKEGHIYYFYLVSKKRALSLEVKKELKKCLKTEKSLPQFLACMALGRSSDEYLGRAAEMHCDIDKKDFYSLEKEFIILAGLKRYRGAYGVLEKISDTNLAPFVSWAKKRIRAVNKIKYDNKDRVILKNPYWEKYADNPVFPTVINSFKSVHTANPDIIVNKGMIYFYYRGGDGNDRIALATIPYEHFDGTNFIDYRKNPIIDIGEKSFDKLAVLDPATVFFKGKVFLYYSGLSGGQNGPDAVGLAVSGDFYNFKKAKNNPVLIGRAPEVVEKDGVIYMYYVLVNETGGYSVYLATSSDGYRFKNYSDIPVFTYSDDDTAWDSKSVTVPRITEKNGVYYMIYAGDNKYLDYPPYFGIAFSYDLVNWYRGTQNPVFSRGKKGTWDDGGIWYGQIFEYKDKWYIWYEGWGGGQSHEKEYGPGGYSQIGLATGSFNIEDLL